MNIFKKYKDNKLEKERIERERLAEIARKEEERRIQEEKQKKIEKIRNGFGIFFVFIGLASVFTNGILASLCMIIFGLTLTTYFDLILKNFNFSLNRIVRICIPIVFFLGIGVFSPTTDKPSNQTLKNDTSNIIVETIEPTVESTELPVQTTKPTVAATVTPNLSPKPTSVATNSPVSKKDENVTTQVTNPQTASVWADACDLSGYREPNAIVDIGYGDREYWAYTNEHGQLVKVTAKEIILQTNDEANSNGRYCSDEAKVPGTEDKELDEGHVIADSLGGVSNAYNITPQNSTLNRHGTQAYMEDQIRKALNAGGTCVNFEALITYPDNTTQIPSRYKYTYTLNGNVVVDEFDNVNPETTVPQNNNSGNDSSDSHKSENTYVEPQAPVVQEPVVEEPEYSAPEPVVTKYILNNDTMKFHTSSCRHVNSIKPENYGEHWGSRDELISWGYSPCKVCKP